MTQPSVFLVPQSVLIYIFPLFFLTPFLECAFTCAVHIWQSEDTCWYTLMCKERGEAPDKRPSWRVRRITLKPKPHGWQRQVQFCRCVTGLLFSASLLPCSALRSDSSWLIQAAYHSDPLTGWLKTWCLTVGWRRRSGWYQTLVYRWARALSCISTIYVWWYVEVRL